MNWAGLVAATMSLFAPRTKRCSRDCSSFHAKSQAGPISQPLRFDRGAINDNSELRERFIRAISIEFQENLHHSRFGRPFHRGNTIVDGKPIINKRSHFNRPLFQGGKCLIERAAS